MFPTSAQLSIKVYFKKTLSVLVAMECRCQQDKLLKEEAGGPVPPPRHSPTRELVAALARHKAGRASSPSCSASPLLGIPERSSCLERGQSCTGVSQERRPNNAALSVLDLDATLSKPGDSWHFGRGDLACMCPCALHRSTGEAVLMPEITHCGAQKRVWAVGGVWCSPL